MKKKLKNVRKVRFGLMLQFSLIMVTSIALITVLISTVLFKNNEQNILSEMTRFSGAILKGGKDQALHYLYYDREIRNSWKSGLNPKVKKKYMEGRDEAIDNLARYFPRITGEESILDITYLINIVDYENWESSNKNRFIYFKRKKPGILNYVKKVDPVLIQLVGHYIDTVEPDIHMVFADGAIESMSESETEKGELKKDIVAVGIPIFSGDDTEALYKEYRDFSKRLSKSGSGSIEKGEIAEKIDYFNQIFIKRLVYNYSDYDYRIDIKNDKDIDTLFSYFAYIRYKGKLTKDQRKFLSDEFKTELKSNKGKLGFNLYKELCTKYSKKYNLTPRYPDLHNWTGLYRHLTDKGITIKSHDPLEKLALLAYQSDLNGILGLHLVSTEFYANLDKNRKDVVNIGLSLFIRCLIIALFFPTFIIKKINTLADGAYTIGRGDFDKRIDIAGSDEMGRLADIFNVMGKNLKKAREEMVEKQRMAEELKTAQQIQSILLPETLPQIDGFEFAAYYSAQTEAGGDYYDLIPLSGDRLAIAVADVSGHGVGAGLVMTITRTLIHSYSENIGSADTMATELNRHLYENTASNYFVTMFYGILNTKTRKLSFVSAGHNPTLILRNNKVQELPAGGVALGAVSETSFAPFVSLKNVELKKGDYLIQYSDGIVEAMDPNGEEFGEERFYAALNEGAGSSAEQIKENIVKKLKSFTKNSEQHDDITLLIVRLLV